MGRPGKKQEGCRIYQFKPEPCQNYYCSLDTPEEKLRLIDWAEEQNLVTSVQAAQARVRV